MRREYRYITRLFSALAMTLTLMLAGCGGDANSSAASSGSSTTVEAMLEKWEAGEGDAALDTLLDLDWDNPPLAEDSLLAVSNPKLAGEGNIARAAELAQEAKKDYFDDWYALGQYALEELDEARAAGDEARANEIETSLDAMVEFLKRPEHLGIFQRLGPALEPLAPGETQLPEGF